MGFGCRRRKKKFRCAAVTRRTCEGLRDDTIRCDSAGGCVHLVLPDTCCPPPSDVVFALTHGVIIHNRFSLLPLSLVPLDAFSAPRTGRPNLSLLAVPGPVPVPVGDVVLCLAN